MEILDVASTNPVTFPSDGDLLIEDTDVLDDEYDSTGLIALLSGDVGDSDDRRANVQNLVDIIARNSVFHTP